MGVMAFPEDCVAVKVIDVMGSKSATIVWVRVVNDEHVIVGQVEDYEPDGVNVYNRRSGFAACNYIPGCVSYLVPFDEDATEHVDVDAIHASS